MYAIISDSGQQFKVTEGESLQVDLKKNVEPGSTMTFDRVLMVVDGDDVSIGQPVVTGAKVTATVEGTVKGPKIHVVKFKRRKDSRRHIGHRQKYTRVKIDKIEK